MIDPSKLSVGQTVIYNDGRAGHQDVSAVILAIFERGMEVQFEDRAQTTWIRFAESEWIDYLRAE